MPTQEDMKDEEVKEEAKPVKKAAPKKKAEKADKKVESVEKLDAADAEASVAAKGGSFIPTVGRRKTAIARVRLIKNGKGLMTVNGKQMEKYFTTYELKEIVTSPLKITGNEGAVDVSVKVVGGGIRGQAEAVRHGLSRALLVLNPTYRAALKKLGFLTRDPRKRERKKPGLKSARRAPQWSKR